jgi:hypothetical protein
MQEMSSDKEIRAKLQQASQLLSSGSKAEAKKLVDEVLQASPHDADAWFIASLVTDTLEQKFSALELALQINPQHTKSKEYLVHLKKETQTDISQKSSSQGVGNMIGKVVSEAAKLIGELLGLASPSSNETELDSDEGIKPTSHPAQMGLSPTSQQKSKDKMNRYQGKGKVVTGVIDLQAGVYKIDYQFPETSNIQVVIVNLKTGDKSWFVYEKGSGAKTYHLEETGRFVLEIDDNDQKLNWKFEFELLA